MPVLVDLFLHAITESRCYLSFCLRSFSDPITFCCPSQYFFRLEIVRGSIRNGDCMLFTAAGKARRVNTRAKRSTQLGMLARVPPFAKIAPVLYPRKLHVPPAKADALSPRVTHPTPFFRFVSAVGMSFLRVSFRSSSRQVAALAVKSTPTIIRFPLLMGIAHYVWIVASFIAATGTIAAAITVVGPDGTSYPAAECEVRTHLGRPA